MRRIASSRDLPALPVLERFDYSPLGQWAVIRLIIRVPALVRAPADAALFLDHSPHEAPLFLPARACRIEQRIAPGAGGGMALLWCAAMVAALGLVRRPETTFAVCDQRGDLAMALPRPAERNVALRALSLQDRVAPRAPAGARRRQALAAVTAVSLTSSLVPTSALAAAPSDGTSSPTTSTVTGASPSETSATAATAAPATTTPTTVTTPSSTDAAATTATPTPAQTTTAIPATTATTPTTATDPTAATSVSSTTVATASDPATSTATATVTPTATAPIPTAPASPATSTPAPTTIPPSATAPVAPAAPATSSTTATTPARPTRRTEATPPDPTAPAQSGAREHQASRSLATESTQRAQRVSEGADRARRRAASASAAARRQAILQAGLRQATQAADAGAPTPTATLSQLPAETTGFVGPASWTGAGVTVAGLTGVVRNQAGSVLAGDGPPAFLIPIYIEAGRRYHVPWPVLAAINSVETDYGRNLNTSSAGAIGWMQFEPSTWRRYGVAADGHSVANPYDPRDAIFAAARYLQAAGAESDLRGAIFSYNHAGWYVDEVMARAEGIAARRQYARLATSRRGTVSVDFATRDPDLTRIRFRGGVMSHIDRLITAANMVSAADFPYVWGGGHEQPARFGPFDCSGSVSYVMQQAGYELPTSVSGSIGSWGLPRGPGKVTIFYNNVHTFMRIGNRYFGTSGFARPGGGAGWFDTDRLPAGYLAQFDEVHVPQLGDNSFAAGRRAIVIPKLTPRERQHEAEIAADHSTELARLSVAADAARASRTLRSIADALRSRFVNFARR